MVLRRGAKGFAKARSKVASKGSEESGHHGGILMRWPWRQEARLIEPRLPINSEVLELQTAKEILAEVFHTRPKDVDEMIQRRLEEWDRREWPATFCLGD